jgi:antitoxin component of MazEF toxin-antitoxin module
MITTLKKLGNSQALLIQKPILEALNIDEDTPLQLVISGGSLIITPARVGFGKERVKQIMKELRPRYGKMLKDLADR